MLEVTVARIVADFGLDGFAERGDHIGRQRIAIDLEAKPERVVTVNWANHEVPLALGVVPVGMAFANFGDDDDDGLLPWVKERLEELGAETPVLFDEGDGILLLRLGGTCQGCAASTVTLRQGIEARLREMVPEVKHVEAV